MKIRFYFPLILLFALVGCAHNTQKVVRDQEKIFDQVVVFPGLEKSHLNIRYSTIADYNSFCAALREQAIGEQEQRGCANSIVRTSIPLSYYIEVGARSKEEEDVIATKMALYIRLLQALDQIIDMHDVLEKQEDHVFVLSSQKFTFRQYVNLITLFTTSEFIPTKSIFFKDILERSLASDDDEYHFLKSVYNDMCSGSSACIRRVAALATNEVLEKSHPQMIRSLKRDS